MDIKERLAEYVHEAWSGWMDYMFMCSAKDERGQIIIPPKLVERWERQMATPYYLLPENEKQSDRDEADKIIEIWKTQDPSPSF